MVKRSDLSQSNSKGGIDFESTKSRKSSLPKRIRKTPLRNETKVSSTEFHLVCFSLDNEEYGVDIYQVHEIIRLPEVIDVPDSPAYIKGVINLRRKTIPVIDSRALLGLTEAKYSSKTRLIILDRGGLTAGLIVDDVTEVLRGRFEQVSKKAGKADSRRQEFMNGFFKLGDKSVAVINCDRVLGF